MFKPLVFLLSALCIFSSTVMAQWSTPGNNFNGGIKFGGSVTNNRNPWVWKIPGYTNVPPIKERSRSNDKIWNVDIPLTSVLLGKINSTVPSGREGLIPIIRIGEKGQADILKWIEPGIAEVTLPIKADEQDNEGSLSFKIKVSAMIRTVNEGIVQYFGVYNDMGGNGIPDSNYILPPEQTVAALKSSFFNSSYPKWFSENMIVSTVTGVSRLTDKNLHNIDAVYAMQVISGSGKLQLTSDRLPTKWNARIPVSIEYQ